MKFTSIVMLVASTSAAGPADWMPCLEQNCSSASFKCCNLITTGWG